MSLLKYCKFENHVDITKKHPANVAWLFLWNKCAIDDFLISFRLLNQDLKITILAFSNLTDEYIEFNVDTYSKLSSNRLFPGAVKVVLLFLGKLIKQK